MNKRIPIIGICGYSGSGKTTVIESLIPLLLNKGLRVAVIKHDAHGINIDTPGKDSYRFFEAGADVIVHDALQSCLRRHADSDQSLSTVLSSLGNSYDLIIVEGHKATKLPNKTWLLNENENEPPEEIKDISYVLARDANRTAAILEIVNKEIIQHKLALPVWAGILFGGKSSRMGKPKQMMQIDNQNWLEKTIESVSEFADGIALLGPGQIPKSVSTDIPVIPDIPDRKGPLAGIISAMRWNPDVSWLILSCDLPLITKDSISWLLAQRSHSYTAIVPTINKPEPLFAWYHPSAREVLETCHAPREIITSDRVLTITPPDQLQAAWTNINTPKQLNILNNA